MKNPKIVIPVICLELLVIGLLLFKLKSQLAHFYQGKAVATQIGSLLEASKLKEVWEQLPEDGRLELEDYEQATKVKLSLLGVAPKVQGFNLTKLSGPVEDEGEEYRFMRNGNIVFEAKVSGDQGSGTVLVLLYKKEDRWFPAVVNITSKNVAKPAFLNWFLF